MLALRPLCRNVSGIFCVYKFWRILPGIFLADFSGAFFSPCAPAEVRRSIFLDFLEGNFVGNLAGILRDFFRTHKKTQIFRGKFWSFFREKLRSPKKIFRAKIRSADMPPNTSSRKNEEKKSGDKSANKSSASPKPHPSKPHPCNMPQAKTEIALQFSECCAAEIALQHSLVCTVDVILTKSCAAASEKLHCNIAKAALQESGAFLPLSCGFQAPTFGHPRLGPAEKSGSPKIKIREKSVLPKTDPNGPNLGGNFGPEKKYLAPPPPPNSPQTPGTLPAPCPPSPARRETPPPGIFNKESSPPPSPSVSVPPPLPPTEKNKKYPRRPPSNTWDKQVSAKFSCFLAVFCKIHSAGRGLFRTGRCVFHIGNHKNHEKKN